MNDDLIDALGMVTILGLITSLMRSPSTAQQISAAGNAYSAAVKAATGVGYYPPIVDPVPPAADAGVLAGVDERMNRAVARFMEDEDAEVSDLEADLDRELGFNQPPSGSGLRPPGTFLRRATAYLRQPGLRQALRRYRHP